MRKTNLERLSQQFVDHVLKALRSASVDELAEALPQVKKLVEQRGRDGNRALRSPRDTAEVVKQVAELLRDYPHGLRSEELQRQLGVHAARMRLAIVELVRQGRVVRQGRARGVRYVLVAEGTGKTKRPPAAPAVDPELVTEVRQRLASSPVPLTAAGLEAAIESPKEAIRAALEELADRGEAARLGAGRFRALGRGAGSSTPPSSTRVLRRRPLATEFTAPDELEARGAE